MNIIEFYLGVTALIGPGIFAVWKMCDHFAAVIWAAAIYLAVSVLIMAHVVVVHT